MSSSNDVTESTTTTSSEDSMVKAKQLMSSWTQNSQKALGSLIPTNALRDLTTRKYTLPDKTVASQVLMYRQLLHTAAKPSLKLSRPYQKTPAQEAVKHMPWWEQGMEESGRMVISYDNLIVRLWLNGAILPYTDLLNSEETMIDEHGLPPVPHDYWVDRLGFQQPDPVTDFRSGGVLSLGLMVYIVESKPEIYNRFVRDGDASVLPFGLTCINVTDMLAKFLMLAKSVDRMDALLSQKPFWLMFGDPNAILALQEISLTILCDVVVELQRVRKLPCCTGQDSHGRRHDGEVSVFDFPIILETTERRVGDDLLGAGPKSVVELRAIASKLRAKWLKELEEKEQKSKAAAGKRESPPRSGNVLENVAQGVLSSLKSPNFMRKSSSTAADTDGTTKAPDLLTANSPDNKKTSDSGWANVHSTANETTDVTTAVGEFCIDDDDEDI